MIQHIDCEGPGEIATWANENQHDIYVVRADQGDLLPEPNQTDFLILLGGTFDINDDSLEWLKNEKAQIKKFIAAKSPILAICGGAQLLTVLLGGSIKQNPEAEIGWFKIHLAKNEITKDLEIQDPFAFHWHREAFTLPPRAIQIASSEATTVQAYRLDRHIVAMQFHPEINEEIFRSLISTFGYTIEKNKPYQQSPQKMRSLMENGNAQSKALLNLVLDYFSQTKEH